MSKTIFIGGRLESKEKGNVVAGANAILDDTKGKKQNVINKETDDELLRLEQSKQDNLTFDNEPTENSTNPVTSGGVYTAEKALSDAIEAILLLIPSAATILNKLVDTNTMNSSISTATATFRGTYNAVSDLGLTYQATHAQIEAALDALGLTADNNDFAFVQIPVSDQSQDIAKTERFKFNGTNWLYEYDLNTSGFTAAQWAAINSTITLALVQKLAALPTNAELLQALGLKQDVLTFDNAPTTDSNNPVKSGGIKNAIDTAVGDEAAARENADTALSGLIGDEKTRAEGVEGGLNTRLGTVEGSVSTIQGVIPSEATTSNKLVDNLSMTTYIGTIIDNIDATFNVTSTDGHVTLAITQVNGVITSVQLTTSDIASAAALNLKASQADLTALASRVTTAEGNITSLTGRMTTAEGDIDQLLALYNALQQSAPQVIQPTDTWPVANPSTTVIYRVIDRENTPPEYYNDYMWNGTSMVLMATYNNAVDAVPTAGSHNLVESGGVATELNAIGDVVLLKAVSNTSATLSSALNAYLPLGSLQLNTTYTLVLKSTFSVQVNNIYTTRIQSQSSIIDTISGAFTMKADTEYRFEYTHTNGNAAYLLVMCNALVSGTMTLNVYEGYDHISHLESDVKDLTEITRNYTSANKLLYPSLKATGTLTTTKTLIGDVYLENGKTYKYRIWKNDGWVATSASLITIKDPSDGTTLATIVNYETVDSGGAQFAWSNPTGTYTFDMLCGAAYPAFPEELINGVVVYDITDNVTEYVQGWDNNIPMLSHNALTLNGKTEAELIDGAVAKYLVCIGDSITQGSGASTYSQNFYWKLRTALLNKGRIIDSKNYGSAGNTSSGIASINGANPLYVTEGFTLPSGTTEVQISVNTRLHNADNNIANGVNPCFISGVKGTISFSSNKYYFTREVEGTQKSITQGTPITTNAISFNIKNNITTIFVGTNNDIDTNPSGIDSLLSDIDNLVRLSNNGKYVVLLPYKNSTSSTFREKALGKYGQRCIDLYQYFSTRAVLDAIEQGLISEGSQSDWQTILLDDGMHPNDLGHELIYQQILNVVTELDY